MKNKPDDDKWLGVAINVLVWTIFLGVFLFVIVAPLIHW